MQSSIDGRTPEPAAAVSCQRHMGSEEHAVSALHVRPRLRTAGHINVRIGTVFPKAAHARSRPSHMGFPYAQWDRRHPSLHETASSAHARPRQLPRHDGNEAGHAAHARRYPDSFVRKRGGLRHLSKGLRKGCWRPRTLRILFMIRLGMPINVGTCALGTSRSSASSVQLRRDPPDSNTNAAG